MSEIADQLLDLHKQATTERSHFYVAKTCERAILEIKRLEAKIEIDKITINNFLGRLIRNDTRIDKLEAVRGIADGIQTLHKGKEGGLGQWKELREALNVCAVQ